MSVNVLQFDTATKTRASGFNSVVDLLTTDLRNVAEQLIEKGLAGVVRHKRDDEDRSSDYDKLMAAEQA